MSKVSGSYESVVRGVSEQNPQSRLSGQHFAQVNMISDPVRGLARRHGSWLEDERVIGAGSLYAPVLDQTATSRVFPFFVGGSKYDLVARTASAEGTGADQSLAFCFNRTTRKFIPVSLGSSQPVVDLIAGGISAMANVGRYLYIAGNSIVPAADNDPVFASAANKRLLVGWVRAGAYAREFKVTLTKADGTLVTAMYKTKAASYPTLLDTSDILASDTEYQKKVNDRVNAYNSAVTAWIGEAAEDITPNNIVTELRLALIAAGVSGSVLSTNGAYLIVDSADYVEIDMNDSGDDSLVRGVGNVVDNLDAVSSRHFVGKIVKVEPETTSADPVYLKAFAKNDTDTGFAEVVWREAPGVILTPQVVFCFGTVDNGVLHIAGSATELESMTGLSEVPAYNANSVGDELSTPLPTFFGRKIDYLGVFQDRLVIGAGSTLFFSRPGDYLNWFRQSVLSIQDNDPWEGYALGAEDDTIKHSVLYDRSLLLFGERFQYVVSGRTAFTPATANIAITSAYEGAIEAAPKTSGNYVFYAQHSGVEAAEAASLQQMQPSSVADVSDSETASAQLDKYLDGLPQELVTMTTPNMVLLRVNRHRRRFYVYSYLDNKRSGERLFDSWSYWDWGDLVGDMVGLSKDGSDILLYTLKTGQNADGDATVWISCEKFVRDTGLSKYPYLDSLRNYPAGYTGSLNAQSDYTDIAIAVGQGLRRFVGTALETKDEFLAQYPAEVCYIGQAYSSYVTPTNPYMKDRNGQPILAARLTLSRVSVAVSDTGGLVISRTSSGVEDTVLNFTGRILGQPSNLIGQQPIVTTSLTGTIGREVKACTYTIKAVSWLPLTINSIDWVGQAFFNTRRA